MVAPPDGKVYSENHIKFSIDNYARKSDAEKIMRSNNTREYFSETKSTKDLWIRLHTTSCDIEDVSSYITQHDHHHDHHSTQHDHHHDHDITQHGHHVTQRDLIDFFQHETYSTPLFLEKAGEILARRTDKADPNTTYVIDVGFVISDNTNKTISFWRDHLDQTLLIVNDLYQRSGVNVEFRSKAVEPFEKFRDDMMCPSDFHSLTEFHMISVLNELVPRFQKDYGVDLLYGVVDMKYGGLAKPLNKHTIFPERWAALGVLNELYNATNRNSKMFVQAKILAHEFGHNLGLHHSERVIVSNGGEFPWPHSFRPNSFGYHGDAENSQDYGTVMSFTNHLSFIPRMSSNTVEPIDDICENYREGPGYQGFCVNFPEYEGDLRLGDENADASDALQYSIHLVSKYVCSPDSC